MRKIIKCITSLLVLMGCKREVWSQILTVPPSFTSQNGTLHESLSLENSKYTIANSAITLQTRLFNGIFPGPTFRLRPGDTLQIDFTNKLQDQGLPFKNNQISAPDETNIHFHGLHVSGELPSDDSTFVLKPGDSFSYSTKLPEDHMPGTHWLHPHRHGSTSLQVGGGAVSAIIVEDPIGTLPPQVENATEVIFLAQQLDLRELSKIASKANDGWFRALSGNGNYITINGQLSPKIKVNPGEWLRFRVIWAAWLEDPLDFVIPGCEMQLLAKDGIYIRDFPRSIQSAPIMPGGRADIMVRCSGASKTYNVNGSVGRIALVETSETSVQSEDLQNWTPNYPSYLSDLRDTAASDICSCTTSMDNKSVNNKRFTYDGFLHEAHIDSIVERRLDVKSHPYHQHVYPYQIITGFSDGTSYNVPGDWHDTIEGRGVVRYKPTIFTGKVMVHCHRLKHEDEGMMAIDMVHPSDNPKCVCNSNSANYIRSNQKLSIIFFTGLFLSFL